MSKLVKKNVEYVMKSGVRFVGNLWEGRYLWGGRYFQDDRVALWLDDKNGQKIANVSLNIDEDLNDDEIFIKDYSENDGIMDQMIAQGIVSEPIGKVDVGHVQVHKVKYLLYEE